MSKCFKCGSTEGLAPFSPDVFVCSGCVREIDSRIRLAGSLRARLSAFFSEDTSIPSQGSDRSNELVSIYKWYSRGQKELV